MCTCVLNEIKTAPQNKTGHCENQIRPPGGTGPFMHVATQKVTTRSSTRMKRREDTGRDSNERGRQVRRPCFAGLPRFGKEKSAYVADVAQHASLLQGFCFLLPRRHRASLLKSFSGFSVPIGRILRGLTSFHWKPYFGGCSSPFNQPVTLSVLSGSGRSQSKHWNLRSPLPPGGSARIKKAPQPGQVGRSAWPMTDIL